jgi:hypothetical protein
MRIELCFVETRSPIRLESPTFSVAQISVWVASEWLLIRFDKNYGTPTANSGRSVAYIDEYLDWRRPPVEMQNMIHSHILKNVHSPVPLINTTNALVQLIATVLGNLKAPLVWWAS